MNDAPQRPANQRAEGSAHLYRTLFEQSPVGVFVFDADLVIIDVNDRCLEIAGTTRDKMVGLDQRQARDQSIVPAMEAALQGHLGLYEGPYRTTTSDRDLWFTMKTAPRLGPAGRVLGGIAVVVDATDQRRTEETVRHLLLHDTLTGLPNRDLFEDRVDQLAAIDEEKRPFAVLVLDIDRFKTVHNSLGHAAADRLLIAIGDRLTTVLGETATLARTAGNEFMVLLPEARDSAAAVKAVDRVRGAFGQPWVVDRRELYLTLSAGIAMHPDDGWTSETLMRNATTALRRAKEAGGDAWHFFHQSMHAEAAERLGLETDLHRALELGRFVLHFQPQVSARTGGIVAVEALIRWQDPQLGIIPPLDFIGLAEETGLMIAIGTWVLWTACRQAAAWNRDGDEGLCMSVNLSPRQFQQPDLLSIVRRVLSETQLAGDRLELEITETAALLDPMRTSEVLYELKELGVRIALDDFGTGYSSLTHLARLPIDTVKIDRSFVGDLQTSPQHLAVANSIITLGHELGLTVVAEGVETLDQAAFLQERGCDLLQGFLFSAPAPADECTRLLEVEETGYAELLDSKTSDFFDNATEGADG